MAHPVRRNIAHLSASERQAYIDAVLQADLHAFSDGVSYWDKQDQIHQVTHKGPWGAALLVTGTPLPWAFAWFVWWGRSLRRGQVSVAVPGAWAAVHEQHHAGAEEASDQGACAASAEQGPQPEADQR